MNVTKARLLLAEAAKTFDGKDFMKLEFAAIVFTKAKQKNANQRDKWKLRKRLTVSPGATNENPSS
jgi:hypothetical protein